MTPSASLVKINAIVPEYTREAARSLAAQNATSVQSVVALALDLGIREIHGMNKRQLRRKLEPDGRRKQ